MHIVDEQLSDTPQRARAQLLFQLIQIAQNLWGLKVPSPLALLGGPTINAPLTSEWDETTRRR